MYGLSTDLLAGLDIHIENLQKKNKKNKEKNENVFEIRSYELAAYFFAHSFKESKIGRKSLPISVSEYSTLGGTTG